MPSTPVGHRGSTVSFALTVIAAAGLAGPAVAAAALAPFGLWTWWVGLGSALLGAAAGLRLVDGWGKPATGPGQLLVLLISAAFGVWAFVTHSEKVLGGQGPAHTLLSAISLNRWGSVPFRTSEAELFGEALLSRPDIAVAGSGFVQVGSASMPALDPGLSPATFSAYAVGGVLGGPAGSWFVAALIGCVTLLAVGALADSVVGGWWPALATAAAGVTFPVLYASRSTTLTLVALPLLLAATLLSGLAIGSGRHRWRHREKAALGAGLLYAAACLVRRDAVVVVLVLLVVLLVTGWRHGRHARSLAQISAAASAVALVANQLATRRTVGSLTEPDLVVPLSALAVALALVSFAPSIRRPDGRDLSMPSRLESLGAFLGGSVVLAGWGASLLTRPGTAAAHWVGWPVLALGAAASAAAVVVAARDGWASPRPTPALALLLGLGSTAALVLGAHLSGWSASEDLALVLLCLLSTGSIVVGAQWLVARARRQWRTVAAASAAILALASPLFATAPLASTAVEAGELATVEQTCRLLVRLGDGAVVDTDGVGADWAAAIRAQCGIPTVTVTPDSAVEAVAATVSAVGGQQSKIVLVATSLEQLTKDATKVALTADAQQLVDHVVQLDPATPMSAQAGRTEQPLTLWAARVSPAS